MSFKHILGKLIPAAVKEAQREKSGCSLHNNPSVAITFEYTSEEDLKQKKKFIQHLKGEYGLRDILIQIYVDEEDKNIPEFLGHFKELDYFTKSDLNWRLKPTGIIEEFCSKKYDLLIDLTDRECRPLSHVLAASKAKLKIGKKGSVNEEYLDFTLDVPENTGDRDLMKHIEYYLSNLSFN